MHTPTAITRPRWRTRLTLVAALTAALAACALPAAASAATVAIERDGTLRYSGSSIGTTLTIRELADAFEVTDSVRLDPIPNGFATCTRLGTRTALCPRNRGIVLSRVAANLDGGDDIAGPINTHLPVEISGGSGEDTYNAGNPSFLTNVKFLGGSGGGDTVSYAGSGGSAVGGVQISNDGRANDGRIGLDTDNIGRDVENLTGSRFADEIAANGPLELRVTGVFAFTSVRGGQGDDVLRVGADGNQGVEILNGPVADGADKIVGGPAISFVDYSERTRAVTATLNFGGADDGEAGEGDEILGGNEVLIGGQADDVLRAPFGSRARHAIDGNGGGDFIEGADGPDSLDGGPGVRDVIVATGGEDQVFAKDGQRDELDCGPGSDTFDVDAVDSLVSCENGTVGVLRLACKTQWVKTGETARLRLAWRHPRSWKQLRRIELRLYRGNERVGRVTIRPRGRQIKADGAVSLVRKPSRLARKGKAVSARLALRLDRSLTGRRLRLEVEAVDRRGGRQRERTAGSIRIAG